MQNRRVVCTGIGVLSALGSNLESFSKNLFDGQSAIRRYPSDRFLPAALHLAAGCIPDFDPGCIDYDQKILARCDLFIAYALHAAFAAIKHSGLNDNLESYDRMRAGVCFGSG
ncbi:MAG: hypothetical protein FJ161_01805, partial [Gammaproteobacteria bacterium]|nr:hypothetical protein [Gammaproteobacteria bacterium]